MDVLPPAKAHLPVLVDMPPEIVISIMDFLPVGDAMLLSLTCQRFNEIRGEMQEHRADSRNLVYRLNKCTGMHDRLAFLMLLEKDLPGWLLCTVHEKLHRRRKQNEKHCVASQFSIMRLMRELDGACQFAQGSVRLLDKPTDVHVHRMTLDLILRRSCLGLTFGLPQTIINHTSNLKETGIRVMEGLVHVQARVVYTDQGGPHLLVRKQYEVEFDIEKDDATQFSDAGIGACVHYMYLHPDSTVETLRELGEGKLTFAESRVFRCSMCPTDIKVTAQRPTTDVLFPVVTYTATRDLGGRGFHFDKIWTAQTNQSKRAPFDRNTYAFGLADLGELWDSAGEQV